MTVNGCADQDYGDHRLGQWRQCRERPGRRRPQVAEVERIVI